MFISTKIKVHKLNGYLLLDIDRYTHLQMEIRSIIGDVESKEVKPDFRVISRVLNETGFCNRNNNPRPGLTTATRLLLKALAGPRTKFGP